MFIRSKKTLLAALASVMGASLLAGCATNLLTYSQDFDREGNAQFDRGDYVDAAGSFKAASKQNPADYHAQFGLARSYEKSGQFHQAIEAYELCLKMLPVTLVGRNDKETHAASVDHLASCIAASDSAEAEIDSMEKEAAAQHSVEDYHILARVFAQRGDPDSAVDSYRKALAFASNDFGLNKEYGLYLAKINQTAEAARVLRHAYDLNSEDAELNNSLRHLGQPQVNATPAASVIPAAVSETPRE